MQLPELYYKWTGFLNIFDIDWSNFFIPGACLEGGYTSRLLLRSVGPLVLIVVVFLFSVAVYIGQALIATESLGRSFSRTLVQALVKSLPSVLFLSFCLCAPTASAIFKTWDCVEYVEDSLAPTGDPEVIIAAGARFLRADLRTTCNAFDGSEITRPTEYAEIESIAWVFAIIYSIVFPCIFMGVLLPSRKSLQQRRSTQMVRATAFSNPNPSPSANPNPDPNPNSDPNQVRATAFLHREYEPEFFCAAPRLKPGLAENHAQNVAHLYLRVAGWEPMFLFERLVIVGWVQLIPREYEYGRLLLGLIVSILYLSILLNQTPYKRDDLDNFANILQACTQTRLYVMCASSRSIHGMHVICTWSVHGVCMVRAWYVHGLCVVCAWYVHGMCMVCACEHGLHTVANTCRCRLCYSSRPRSPSTSSASCSTFTALSRPTVSSASSRLTTWSR